MVKIRKTEKILVDHASIMKLSARFACNRTTVYNALAFRSDSRLARDIRAASISEYGGAKIKVSSLAD